MAPNMLKALYKSLPKVRVYIEHVQIPPDYAQANPIERINKTAKFMNIAHIKPDYRTWDNDLINIIWTYNTLVHETTGYIPCYGRNPELSPTVNRSAEHKAALEYV